MRKATVAATVARVANVSWAMQRSVGAFGTGTGLGLALADLRRSSSVKLVTPPFGGSPQAVRLGRGESDLKTFVQVFGARCYEFDSIIDPTWIIDAGANVGYSATWFATTYPKAKVLAIEPDESNFRLLVRNTSHLANVIPVWAALSDRPGDALVVDPGDGAWSLQVQRADARWSSGESKGSVRCVNVGGLVADYGIDRIGLLKLDIEGGELEVLRASADWMPLVQAIVAELHDRFRPGCTRAFMDATQGFPIEAVRGENFLAARLPDGTQ